MQPASKVAVSVPLAPDACAQPCRVTSIRVTLLSSSFPYLLIDVGLMIDLHRFETDSIGAATVRRSTKMRLNAGCQPKSRIPNKAGKAEHAIMHRRVHVDQPSHVGAIFGAIFANK